MKKLVKYLISDLGEDDFDRDPESNPVFIGVFVTLILLVIAGIFFNVI